MEAPLAFVRPEDAPGLEIRVNFGIFAGRDATPAEIDSLAELLLPEVGEVTIVAEERHQIDANAEASVHQVRIEVDPDRVPGGAQAGLQQRLVQLAGAWAHACIEERRAEAVEL